MAGLDHSPISISVIIVNYNGRHHLASCLRSLQHQTLPNSMWETIVVDNGSRDGSAEYVRRAHPHVRLIPLEQNLGFAGGNNVGFQHARGRYLALLNNDATADPSWLEAMWRRMESTPALGGVACKILFQHAPGVLNSTGLELYRDGRGGDRGLQQPDQGQFDTADDVFGACGAAMMLRRSMLDEIGPFDERLFMYYEDLDLAWRARARGWHFLYEPTAVVHHVHCGSSGASSPFLTFHVERNRVLVNVKNASMLLALLVSLGLVGRIGRAWYRVLLGTTTVAHGMAFLRAAFSAVTLMPHALRERYRLGMNRQRTPTETVRIEPRSRAAA